jgi:predicted dehydrogenase
MVKIMKNRHQITFGIVGGGFRAPFYLRVAQAVPERFSICGLSTASPERTEALRRQTGVKAFESPEALLAAQKPDFLVVCKKRDASIPEPMEWLVTLGIPLLMETPAGWDMDSMRHLYEITKGKPVQVAEQFWHHPENVSRMKVAASGLIGHVTQVEISCLHTFHGVSLMRKLLGIGFETAEIHANHFAFPVVEGYMRTGIAPEEKIITPVREISLFDFGGKLGVYDYEEMQNRSYVRGDHLTVRGERGEIFDRTVRWLADNKTPLSYTCERQYAGVHTNLEGFYFRGITGGGEWLYRNPYPGAPLCDDELALAAMLERMADYVRTGEAFYSVAEACQDQYLSLMADKAATEGPLKTVPQIWTEA